MRSIIARIFGPEQPVCCSEPVRRRSAGGSWFWILFGTGIPAIGLAAASRTEAMALLFVWASAFALLWFSLAFYYPERARSVAIFWLHVADAVQRFQEQRSKSAYLVD